MSNAVSGTRYELFMWASYEGGSRKEYILSYQSRMKRKVSF